MASGLVGVFLPLGGIAPAGAAPGDFTVVVTKDNDAGEGTQSGDDVTFEVTVTNPNAFPVTITAVTDTVGNGEPFAVCDGTLGLGDDIVGQTLAAAGTSGDSTSCSFTLPDYAPDPGDSVENIVKVTAEVIPGITPGSGALFLVADDDLIDNRTVGYLDSLGIPRTFFAVDVNDDHPGRPERSPLNFFAGDNVGAIITLPTGQEQDEGIFGLTTIPPSWDAAGPTGSGLSNFFGDPSFDSFHEVQDLSSDLPPPHNVGPGLGNGSNPEVLLDKIPNVVAYRDAELADLVDRQVCFLVRDSDLSYDKDKKEGNLQGEYLGVVAARIMAIDNSEETLTALGVFGTTSVLPALRIEILNPNVCGAPEETLLTGNGEDPSMVTTPLPPASTSVQPPLTVAGVVLENPTDAPAVIPAAISELPRTGTAGLREATLLALALLMAGTAVRALGRRRGGLTGS